MYLRLSNGNLLNIDLVSDILFDDMRELATLQGYGINMHVSAEAYRYFRSLPADQIVSAPTKEEFERARRQVKE